MRRWQRWMRFTRRGTAEGQAVIIFALMLPVLAGITGIALDAGNLYFQRRHLQSMADAAALTGAQVANFNADAPAILVAEGTLQARANAIYNGAVEAEVQVHVPPSADAGVFAGRPDYIEVVVTRTVPHAFMGLFGYWSTTTHARAVARCYMPGYGDVAVLALSNDPEAITFNGGSSQAVNIVGDILSNGGIDPNGNASHFQIDGAAYAISQPAAPNLTTTNGSFGTDSGVSLWPVADPIAQDELVGLVVWPNFDELSNGTAYICDDPWPTPTTSGTPNDCPGIDPDDPLDTDTGNVTVGSSEYAVFMPGRYGNVTIRGQAKLRPGVYSFNSLDLGSQARLTDDPDGVLIHIRGPQGIQVDVSGGAEFELHAIQPNSWRDIVLYSVNGDIDLTGNGDRALWGSVYAPNGNVAISGDGGDAIVHGQVIAQTVEFSGNGPTVEYPGASNRPNFGPILVNMPD